MIIDTLNNAAKYHALHPLFAQAFEAIGNIDLATEPDGKKEIADGIKFIFSNAPGKTKEASLSKFECHDKNIDIQLCISGVETIAWKPRENCQAANGDYNQEKDVRFFIDEPDTYFQLSAGQFAIFYPEDVHAPMIGEGNIKKLVVKIRI
jgi:biofilm protein TabA